jgi:hypothetical protein
MKTANNRLRIWLADMRKNGTLSLLIAIFLIGCSLPPVRSSKPHPDRDGFKNIRWGTDIMTLKDMEKVDLGNPSNKDVAWYSKKEDVLSIGKAKIQGIFYSFWMGSFESVWIDFEGDENVEPIKEELSKVYGKLHETGEVNDKGGRHIEQADQIYTWNGENTEVFLFYSKVRHKGNLTLNSKKIAEDRRAYDREKKKEEY